MSRRRASFVAFATTCLVFLASPIDARAQDILLDVVSPVAGNLADHGINIGDWDGDGIDDLAIGASTDGTIAVAAGAARIHSGKDGSVLATWYGTKFQDYFGAVLARMPDLNGDGFDDLAVSAPEADNAGTDTGSVFVYAGRTGALLFRIDGPTKNSVFGGDLGPAGDVDGDGLADLHIARSLNDFVLGLYSGADGHLITNLNGTPGDAFGYKATSIDDLDGDGVPELLVGARYHLNSSGTTVGAAYVVSPVLGTKLRTHEGTFRFQDLGWEVAALADLDGDGVHDYAVASDWDGSGSSSGSKVEVWSGASGALLGKISSASKHEKVGTQVAAAGDLNGDGIGDLAISGYWIDAVGNWNGSAFLVSGKTFLTLDRIDLPDYSVVVAPYGNLNGDAFDDLIVGSADTSNNSQLRIYSGDDLWLEGTPNQTNPGDTVELNVREGAPGTLTLLALEAIDGVPTFQVLDGVHSFGPLGGYKLYVKVSAALSGHDFTIRAYANGPTGKVIQSATQTISCK